MFKNKKIAPSLIDHTKYEGTNQDSYFRVVKIGDSYYPQWRNKETLADPFDICNSPYPEEIEIDQWLFYRHSCFPFLNIKVKFDSKVEAQKFVRKQTEPKEVCLSL